MAKKEANARSLWSEGNLHVLHKCFSWPEGQHSERGEGKFYLKTIL